ncbi:porin [Sediminibacterium sp.]|uniref:porin n=1 Tax=Sediminibacterium sp. TaxID=1917865 RepID=UPI00351D13C9
MIALAIASAVSAPAFAATANVDVYGRMAFSLDYVDTNNLVGDGADVVTGRDNVSRFGLKGTEDLGNGLAAIWQIETALNTSTTGVGSLRNTFIGLSSKSLGTVILGRHDTPYKMATGSLDVFSDTAGDYNTIIGTTSAGTIYDNRAPQMVAYLSPTWTGFSFAAAYAETKNVEAGAGDNQQGFSTMAKYVNGPIFASLAYETFSGAAGGGSTATAETEAYKAGLGVKLGGFQLGAVYEIIDSDAAASANERDAYYANAMYSIGAFDLKAAYGMAKDGESAASTEMDFYAVGADYNLSKRTKLFGVYTSLANGNGTALSQSTTGYTAAAGQDVEIVSVGAVHTF